MCIADGRFVATLIFTDVFEIFSSSFFFITDEGFDLLDGMTEYTKLRGKHKGIMVLGGRDDVMFALGEEDEVISEDLIEVRILLIFYGDVDVIWLFGVCLLSCFCVFFFLFFEGLFYIVCKVLERIP